MTLKCFCNIFFAQTIFAEFLSHGIIMVSLRTVFWPCVCEVFNSDTPDELGCTFVIFVYGCDEGKNIVFECNNDDDFDEDDGQFGSGRPKMMHCC